MALAWLAALWVMTTGAALAAPSIVQQPLHVAASEDTAAAFYARATGHRPITYQWQFNSEDIPGATNQTLVITSLTREHAGEYRVVASDPTGSTTLSEAASLIVNPPSPGYTRIEQYDSRVWIHDMAIDYEGNFFYTGTFNGPGAVPFANSELVTTGRWDAFVAKVTPENEVVWTATAGGAEYAEAQYVTVDSEGNAFVTGWFEETAHFGPYSVTAESAQDVFLVKYDPAGEPLWVRHASGPDWSTGVGLAIDSQGNCFVTGHFWSRLTFDQTTFSLPGRNGWDTFVAKYASEGELLWVRHGAGTGIGWVFAGGIGVDNEGNSYAAGSFQSESFSFGELAIDSSSMSGYEGYLAKFNPEGEVLWLVAAGTAGGATVDAIAVDETGNCYLTGRLNENARFGSITTTDPGFFVARFDAAGVAEWVTSAGAMWSYGLDLVLDPFGGVLVTGNFRGNAVLDGFELLANGSRDTFIAKFSESGSMVWAKQRSSPQMDDSVAIAIDPAGDIYTTGRFTAGLPPGTATADEWVLHSANGQTLVTRLAASRPTLSIVPQPDSVGLSWPVWANGFTLETTDALANNDWTPLTLPAPRDHRYSIEIPTDAPQGFFRLRR